MSTDLRKKKLKHHKKKLQKRIPVPTLKTLLFTKIKCHWNSTMDEYIADIECQINNHRVNIKGVIDPEQLVSSGIFIKTPKRLYSIQYQKHYNINELSLSATDAPMFYKLMKSYIYMIGDKLDANITRSELIDLNLEFSIPKLDSDLEPYIFKNHI